LKETAGMWKNREDMKNPSQWVRQTRAKLSSRYKKETLQPMKPFATIDEEAEFWETHDVIGGINEGTVVGFHKRKTKA
jgi:hypothetical protein